jgi:hypothetical protein
MALGNFLSALLRRHAPLPRRRRPGRPLPLRCPFGRIQPDDRRRFILFTLILGNRILALFNLIPMAILGVLLLFAGSQLALTVLDIKERKEMFVVVLILGITLASNLAAGFMAGIVLAYLLRSEKLTV